MSATSAQSKPHSLEIRLCGQRIVLKYQGEPERAQAILNLVNTRIKDAESRMKEAIPHHAALLALLDLAEEYLEAKDRVRDHQSTIAAKLSGLEGADPQP